MKQPLSLMELRSLSQAHHQNWMETDPKIEKLSQSQHDARLASERQRILENYVLQSEIDARQGHPDTVVMELTYSQIGGETWGDCSDKVKIIGVAKQVYNWLASQELNPKLRKLKTNRHMQRSNSDWQLVVVWEEN